MSAIAEWLATLASMDIKLWVDGEKLRCSGPDHLMTAELYTELAERKVELLAFFPAAKKPGESQAMALLPSERDGEIPLSYGQERLWSLAQMQPNSGVYNISTAFRLVGPLDVNLLEQSLNALQLRYEILRTTFSSDHGRLRQQIAAPRPFLLPRKNLREDFERFSPERRDTEIQRLLEYEIRQPFDLQAGPSWRSRLLRIGKEEYILSFVMHHIIFDGPSRKPFLGDLERLYQAAMTGDRGEVAALPIQYADYACWQRKWLEGADFQRQLGYWQKQLDEFVPELRIPTDHQRASVTKFHSGHIEFELHDKLAQALTSLSRAEHGSLFITLLAGFCVLLNRYTDQEDLIICSPVAGRDRPEIENLIGYFNNIVLLRTDLIGDPSFREAVNRVRRVVLETFENQNVPFQKVAELPGAARTPLTRGMFALRDASIQTLNLPGIASTFVDMRKVAADFDLAMYMATNAGKLFGVLEYNADLFDRPTIARLVQDFQTILEYLVAAPDAPISQLPRFGKAPREIEELLSKHPQIDEAVVVPGQGYPGAIAYVVLNEVNVPSLDDIRAYASASLADYLVPAAFVPLDVMPLADDGSINRAALLSLALTRRRAGSTYVAPRTALERELAEIWRKVLWLDDDVGVHDSFIELGGHSLLSVQLVLELEKSLHRKVPANALAQLSTVEELARFLEEGVLPVFEQRSGGDTAASTDGPTKLLGDMYHGLRTYTAAWQGQRATSESVTVGLNTNGSKEKLFWCLQRYKELTQLAKYLGPDQPVYGMRSGHRVMVKDQANIDSMASFYVGEILAVQFRGPFLIGGNCQAAQIAFQIAKQLGDLGHGITLLFLQEKFIPQEYRGRVALIYGRKSFANPYQSFRNPEFGWKKFYSGVISVDLVSGAHGQFHKEPHIQVLADALRRRIEEAQNTGAQPAESRSSDEFQRLPETAYRAQLSAQNSWSVGPGEEIKIPVTVKNVSSEVWRSSDKSGIALINRWLDKNGNVIERLDGRVPLAHDVAPNSLVELDLTVRSPKRTGRWILELDLVEEGVTWFKDQGSPVTRLQVNVQRSSSWWDRTWSKKDFLGLTKQRRS